MASDFGEVGSAHIRIAPKLDPQFTSKVAKDIDAALRSGDAGAQKLGQSTRQAADNMSRAAASARQTATGLGEAANQTHGFRQVSDDLSRAATSAGKVRAELGATRTPQAIGGDIDRGLRSVSSTLQSANRDLDQFEKSARQVGETGGESFNKLARSIGALAAAYAGFNFFRDSVNLASDLGESMSKAENVFKQATGTVKRFAETSAESFGISQRSALEMGATFGNLLTSMGLSRSEAAGLSVSMLKLGADLASFNNISIDEALGKIRSGLVGEFEPLRSLGVTLNADAVAAEAMSLGLANSTKSVSSAAKIQATYSLILKQTSNAQGDFARTEDGLANTQRKLTAEWENARVQIGEKLLPVALQIASEMSKLIPVATDLGQAVGGVLATGVSGVIPTVRIFANALGTVAPLLNAIPEPLIAVVANFVLLQKTLGKLGFDDVLTKPFKKAIGAMADAAEDGLRGLGGRVKSRLVTEVGGNVIADVFTNATGPASAAASQAGASASQAFAMGVKSSSTEVELWKPGAGTVAIREAGQVGQTAGQAAQGVGSFGAATRDLSAYALPALGVALAVGTTALGMWQQKRAEAAAAQQKHTLAMIADTEAAIANGDALDTALSKSTDSVILQSIDELGSHRRRDDLDQMTTVLDRNVTGLQLWGEAVRSVGSSGDKSTGAVRQFRQALLDLGKENKGIDLNFSSFLSDPGERARVTEEFLRTGKIAVETQAKLGVSISGNTGLLGQFNGLVDDTANAFEQTNAAAEAMNNKGFGTVIGAMAPLKKEIDETKGGFKDAATAVDDFLQAVRSIGNEQIAGLRAEEARQKAVADAEQAVAPQTDVTPQDVVDGELAVEEAVKKRTEAEQKLTEAQAAGDAAKAASADLDLRQADNALTKSQAKLDELQRAVADLGFPIDKILSGMDKDSIDVRKKFDDIIVETLAQTATEADKHGADAAANFWDQAILDTKTRLGPEYAAAVDAALAGRDLAGKTGREVLLEVALKQPLSPLTAQLLSEDQTLDKLIKLTPASGDIPKDLEPLLEGLGTETRIKFAIDLIATLPPEAELDPALLAGLNVAAQKDLILRLAATGKENLPFDPDQMNTLLSDKAFVKEMLINMSAAGGAVDTGTPLGQAVQKAVAGTPLELFINPTLQGDENVKKQLETLSGLVEDKAKLTGDVASPEFHVGVAAVIHEFEEIDTKINDAKTELDGYVSTETPDKHINVITFGLPALEGAVAGLQTAANLAPRIDREVHLSVFGQSALDAALRAVRSLAPATTPPPQDLGPPTAVGGIFSTAQSRLIAEAGAELILPLSGAQHQRAAYLLEQAGVFDRFATEFLARMGAPAQQGGGGRNVNLTVYTNDPALMARKVSQELAREVA